VVDEKSFALGSALHSYILQLHKKVTLVCKGKLPHKFACVAWYKDVKTSLPSSAEYIYEVACESLEVYHYFRDNGVKINQKMAHALYVALFMERDLFAIDMQSTRLAIASELLVVAPNAPACLKQVLQTYSLAQLRLKAKLLQSMLLKADAQEAWVYIDKDDFIKTGAHQEDITLCLEDIFALPYVKEVFFVSQNTQEKIKTVKKEDFEKKK
jgi:nanoRNase/pAp phosphatase (c-di-AMP/oligoRNAs hydrolase)